MRLLLWYAIFSWLLLPIILAPFSGFASLYLYVLYFVRPEFLLYMLAPALLLWIIHLFFRHTFRSLLLRVYHAQRLVPFRR